MSEADIKITLNVVNAPPSMNVGADALSESMQIKIKALQKEVAWLRQQRDRAIHAFINLDANPGGWSCPMDLAYLDEHFVNHSDRMGFRCVHRDFDGQCPLEKNGEATEAALIGCWQAWLERREIG
ncbi:MAG: hypothetical protein M0P69_18050 [Bacteroidales bacterium]|jgi:hypothetical protein|nr:hypothetical protein [Bacteroidales bacterium]